MVPTWTGVYDRACRGEPRAHRIRSYPEKAGERVQLRCGWRGYGYTHIRDTHDGFPPYTNEMIAETLEHWTSAKNSGTSDTFYYDRCDGLLCTYVRVVVQYERYGDGYQKGIITAYGKSVIVYTAHPAH